MPDEHDPRWLEYQSIDDLQPHPLNAKNHDLDLLRRGLDRFGYTQPVSVDERTGLLSAGHGRRELLLDDRAAGRAAPKGVMVRESDGAWLVPVTRGWSSADDNEALAQLVEGNQTTIAGGWDPAGLAEILAIVEATPLGFDGVGFDGDDLKALLAQLDPEPEPDPQPHSSLRSRFLVPPFSLLDARQGYWQDRKRAWLSLGIQSELGRGETLTHTIGIHDYDEYGQRIAEGEIPAPLRPDGTARGRPLIYSEPGPVIRRAADASPGTELWDRARAALRAAVTAAGLTYAQVDQHMGTNGMAGDWLGDAQPMVPTPDAWAQLSQLLDLPADLWDPMTETVTDDPAESTVEMRSRGPRVKRPALHIDHGGGNDVSDRMRAVSLGVRRLSPGGSPRPAMKLGADGRTVRGDGAGAPLNG